MQLTDLLPSRGVDAAANMFRVVRHRLWSRPGTLHVELPRLGNEEYRDFTATLQRELQNLEGVLWARANGAIGRMIVAWDASRSSRAQILGVVDRVEQRFGLGASDYDDDRPDHPGDDEQLVRAAARMVASAAGVGAGVMSSILEKRPGRRRFDLAAVMAVIDNVPRVHQFVTQRLGRLNTETWLGLTNPVIQGMGSGPVGPALEFLYQTSGFYEAVQRRRGWRRFESDFVAEPHRVQAGYLPKTARVTDVPDGPIEEYAQRAWRMSLGGFLVGLADTQQLERAVTPVLDALPKPGRYGRDAFCAGLTAVLADRDLVVMDPESLRVMDRVDTIAVDASLLDAGAASRALIDRLHDRQFQIIAVTDDASAVRRFHPHHTIAFSGVADLLRHLQQEGHVIGYFADRADAPLSIADFSVGFTIDDEDIPWGCDVIGAESLEDAVFMTEAIAESEKVSRQCALFAGSGAGIGALSAIRGLHKTRPGRVMLAVNAASLLALLYGQLRARRLSRRVQPLPQPPPPWHAMEVSEVFRRLDSGHEGITDEQAQTRRSEEVEPPGRQLRLLQAVGRELANPLTPVLAGGAAVSATVGSLTDAAIVAAVIAFNGLAGGMERFNAEEAIEKMARREALCVQVCRNGGWTQLEADKLVDGDIIRLESGDVVPADCRIVDAYRLEVDESTLTGESLPVSKGAAPSDAPIPSDRSSMLYEGTAVVAGQATAVVVATGENTEMRRSLVPVALSRPEQEGVEARLEEFSDMTLPFVSAAGGILMTLGVFRRRRLEEMVGPAVNLAVSAVPEGLPLLSTAAQLAASRRLADRNVIVQNPRAMEAIGRAEVVCLDKTGTLTRGTLQLKSVFDGADEAGPRRWTDSHRAVIQSALRATPQDDDGSLPHTTDQAIVDAADQAGIETPHWEPTAEIPFRTELAFHACVGRLKGRRRLAVKGSPEEVLARCSGWRRDGSWAKLSNRRRTELLNRAEHLAAKGLRVLAVAGRKFDHGDDDTIEPDQIRGLTFYGFVGLSDPVRPRSGEAIEALYASGVTPIMLTGDHPETAKRIAREVGLEAGEMMTGDQVEQLEQDQLAEVLSRVNVIARMTPSHKVRIVEALQSTGQAVAMTGDGGNDAAAIRLADAGIALGADAAPAARDAADLVVTDARVETIVDAVVEGRGMWRSVRDAVSILIGGNLGEILFMLASGVIRSTPALNARQILLVNLFTDVAPALAIALRHPPQVTPEQLLHEGPEQSLGEPLRRDIAWRAALTGTAATIAWVLAVLTLQRKRASTVGLLTVVCAQLGQTLTSAKPDPVVWAAALGSAAALLAIIETPVVSHALGCRPLGPLGLTTAVGASTAAMVGSAIIPNIGRWAEAVREKLPVEPEPTPRVFYEEFLGHLPQR